jgi:proteasome lid subunit RPN8/RPN11
MSEPAPKRGEIVGLRHVCEATIYHHVFTNADREVGGVLVGRVPRLGGPPLVTGAIPALKAEEKRATLTFTQDAWEHVHQVLDRDFDGDQIVGWYHSHPGFGVFLSEHDLFIHRHFFSGPSQIAVVVDPQACSEGIFYWRDGTVRLLYERPTPSGWYVQSPASPPPAGRQPLRASEAQPVAAERERYPFVPIVTASLLGFSLAFVLVYFGLLHHHG